MRLSLLALAAALAAVVSVPPAGAARAPALAGRHPRAGLQFTTHGPVVLNVIAARGRVA